MHEENSGDLNDIHLARALKKATNPIFFIDKSGKVIWCNQSYADLLGVKIPDLLRQPSPSLRPTRDNAQALMKLWSVVLRGETWIGELSEKKANESIAHVDAVITPLADASGHPTLFMVLEHDITKRKLEYEEVYRLANFDRLTGLANRSFFSSMFDRIQAQANRRKNKVAVLFIDLDGFKGVNDSLGHDAGDVVLVETAKILKNQVRKTDIVSRFGGDEFACILDEIESEEAALRIAEKIVATISAITQVPQGSVVVGASIGIAIYPDHGATQDAVRAAADSAMYEAKRGGKGCVRIYAKPT